MTSTQIELAREVYRLLVYQHPKLGLSVPELSEKLDTTERAARQALSDCRKLAAANPHSERGRLVIGYDPETNRCVVARDAEQSRRIMLHLHSRVADMNEALSLMADAHVSQYGQPAPQAVQDTIFQASAYQQKMGMEQKAA